MYLLNIDKPTKSCTLHRSNCHTVLIKETNRKGINRILVDGGWIKFISKEEAINSYEFKQLNFLFNECNLCMKKVDQSFNASLSGESI